MIITKRRFYWMLLMILMLMALFSIEVQAGAALSDIENHWASSRIKSLTDKGIINGYPDGTFKPEQTISRAEFAKIIAKAMGYQEVYSTRFSDLNGHWAAPYIYALTNQGIINGFEDGTFKPEQPISRAQAAAIFTRIVRLATPEEKYSEAWPASFTDVPADHWAFRYIEIANKLNLFPESYQNEFKPTQPATRAESAWMINGLKEIQITKGKISNVDPYSGLVNVEVKSDGDPLLAMVAPDTILLRNNVTTTVDTLLSGDEVTVIALPSEEVKFVKAFGKVTKNDLLSRISSMTKGQLRPEQISAIVAGDWSSIKDDLKGGLYNRMIDMGLTPAEAESIMVQDWSYLDSLSQERLAQALSTQLGITQDFAQALLQRDLEKIKEYGKIELATAALSKILGVEGESY